MATPKPEQPTETGPNALKKKARIAQPRPAGASRKAKPAAKPGTRKKAAGNRHSNSAVRHGSKTEKILELLKRPSGATLQEIMKTTGWLSHSVRGFMSGVLRKKLRLGVDSFKRENAERAYRIACK